MDTAFLNDIKGKMQKALTVLIDDLATIRTGRATPALVENVVITTYEGTQHLKVRELATITTDGPRNILIAPFDPSTLKDIEKGINAANLGFTCVPDGNNIRINLPTLTEERRQEYIKLAHVKVEGGKVMIRQARGDAMAQIKRQFDAKELGEDERKEYEKEIQKITDEFTLHADQLREKKEKELNEI
jgi:ribosome recycling factor